jgi:hypothetical protein
MSWILQLAAIVCSGLNLNLQVGAADALSGAVGHEQRIPGMPEMLVKGQKNCTGMHHPLQTERILAAQLSSLPLNSQPEESTLSNTNILCSGGVSSLKHILFSCTVTVIVQLLYHCYCVMKLFGLF